MSKTFNKTKNYNEATKWKSEVNGEVIVKLLEKTNGNVSQVFGMTEVNVH